MNQLSQSNYTETKNFFKDHKYFGGNRKNFVFYTQGMVPQVDLDGKIIMKRTSEIQLSPNGSGALFESINNNDKIKEIITNADYVQVCSLDNIAQKVLDPLFVG